VGPRGANEQEHNSECGAQSDQYPTGIWLEVRRRENLSQFREEKDSGDRAKAGVQQDDADIDQVR